MKTLLFLLSLALCSFAIAQDLECFEPCFYEPGNACLTIYDPVCGCDEVEYSNDCFALISGIPGWSYGPCNNGCNNVVEIENEFQSTIGTDDIPQSYAADEYCFSLISSSEFSSEASYVWDFGNGETSTSANPCASFTSILNGEPVLELYHIQVTVTDGECAYTHNIKLEVGENEQDCPDLTGVDFGACALALGIAQVNNTCTFVSGCSFFGADGVDYSASFFSTMEECESACANCIDESLIDPEVICPTVVIPVCGCNGVTYNNSCEAENLYGVTSYEEGPCGVVNPEGCADLTDVDFGECEMLLGIGLVDGLCNYISGCSTVDSEGLDYSNAIYSSFEECSACDQSECINPAQINPDANCFLVYEPVCGCDDVTYSNDCVALNSGVTNWEYGECIVDNITERRNLEFTIYPNPAKDFITVRTDESQLDYIELINQLGQTLIKDNMHSRTEIELNVHALDNGMYFLKVEDKLGNQKTERVLISN